MKGISRTGIEPGRLRSRSGRDSGSESTGRIIHRRISEGFRSFEIDFREGATEARAKNDIQANTRGHDSKMRFHAIEILTALLAAAAVSTIIFFVRGGPTARADIHIYRWYDDSRVLAGKEIYKQNCAVCHGPQAQSVPNWRERDADGLLPPPPLDGSAHTWHHPLLVLAQQIKYGTPKGRMPGFQDRLSDQEIIDVIAWIQSLWSDRTYMYWWKIQQISQQRSKQREKREGEKGDR